MYRLHCFSQSGNSFKVAFMLAALRQPWEPVFVDFMVGDAPTIADLSMSAYLCYPPEESGYDLPAQFPHLAAWLARVQAIGGYAPPYDVLPGERILPKW